MQAWKKALISTGPAARLLSLTQILSMHVVVSPRTTSYSQKFKEAAICLTLCFSVHIFPIASPMNLHHFSRPVVAPSSRQKFAVRVLRLQGMHPHGELRARGSNRGVLGVCGC